jgi:hypothetical protein
VVINISLCLITALYYITPFSKESRKNHSKVKPPSEERP